MNALVRKLRHEPVAFWGGLLAAGIAVLTYLGVDQNVLGLVATVATLLGIPLVRSQVTPTAVAPDARDGGATAVELCVVVVAVIAVLWACGVVPR